MGLRRESRNSSAIILTILRTPPQILRYQETYETVRQVVDENGGEMQYTDVAEFLVRQMVDKFHTTDLLLMQVNLSFFES